MCKQFNGEGAGGRRLVWTFDGVGKCLRRRKVSGNMPAGELGLAEQFEQNVWSEWKGRRVVLFEDEGGIVFS